MGDRAFSHEAGTLGGERVLICPVHRGVWDGVANLGGGSDSAVRAAGGAMDHHRGACKVVGLHEYRGLPTLLTRHRQRVGSMCVVE